MRMRLVGVVVLFFFCAIYASAVLSRLSLISHSIKLLPTLAPFVILAFILSICSGYYTESYITLFLPALSAKLNRLGIGNP